MQDVWDIKDQIYEEVKDMNFKEYNEYLGKNITGLKKLFRGKYLKKRIKKAG